MFTGIIEEIGRVELVTRGAKSCGLRIKAAAVLEDTRTGDSVCTSGVCLTVTKLGPDHFEADVMAETMRRTKLDTLTAGNSVNLERALQLNGRLGGHIVSGHIDGTGVIRSVKTEENAVWLAISADHSLLRYIVEKGSIAVDGVSLTVASVDESGFRVSVIPHTGRETTLLRQKAGDTVNLESDVIGKYVEKLFSGGPFQGAKRELTEDLLRKEGFI
jgi:riboflavin synthase